MVCRLLRGRRCLLYLLSLASLILLTVFILASRDTKPLRVKARYPIGRPQTPNQFITTFNHSGPLDKTHGDHFRVKTVLLWTAFFGSKDWGTNRDTFRSCAVTTCRTTMDKGELSVSDAVVMNVRDFRTRSDLPPTHPAQQVWIIHSPEPPYYIYFDAQTLNNVFNWTSWYRSDADIFSPFGYFSAWSAESPGDQKTDLSLKPVSDDNADFSFDAFGLHDRLVFWVASSCYNYAQRYRLVAQLKNYLPVDTYGYCGDQDCKKDERDCERVLKRYKFVLAFENGYCRDYLTEKYWNALNRQQIPVVSGGADYSRLAIPGSYIDVDNFTSVEDLARFLQRVGNDRELYNSFFTWKARYRVKEGAIANWCQICQALHDDQKLPQVYSDFRGWLSDDSCPLHSVRLPAVRSVRSFSRISLMPFHLLPITLFDKSVGGLEEWWGSALG